MRAKIFNISLPHVLNTCPFLSFFCLLFFWQCHCCQIFIYSFCERVLCQSRVYAAQDTHKNAICPCEGLATYTKCIQSEVDRWLWESCWAVFGNGIFSWKDCASLITLWGFFRGHYCSIFGIYLEFIQKKKRERVDRWEASWKLFLKY